MQTIRKIAHVPQSRALACDVLAMSAPCIACTDCRGICQTLIDTLMLPDLILKGHAP